MRRDRQLVLISSHIGMREAGDSGAQSTGRLHAIDTAKGIGILFVVFGHAWRGAFHAGILRDEALFRAVDNMIYAWHMPLFFFLSGLLFLEVVERIEAAPFLASRVRRLLWPFVLWTWLFFGMKLLAGGAANHPVTLADFPLIPLPPYEHLWFLWALFLSQVLVLGLFRALRPVLDVARLRVVFGVLAVALTLLIPFFYVPSPTFGATVEHFPYFVAGIALGGIANRKPPAWLVVMAGAVFGLLIWNASQIWASLLVSLVLTVSACIVFARLDPGAERPSAPIAFLRLLGLYSLPIFLAHTIFSAAFRIGLLKVGVDGLNVHLLVATIVGLAGPIALVWGSRRLGVAKLLGF
ncbi:acyltransferase family protein [Marimonas sp. MJW-29]|uniref:Acyltransferase family protein n=1 Tax=Sulfitobacter sediminis TaxID=3234186 RepID=A0ABV3RLF9_9RHOB